MATVMPDGNIHPPLPTDLSRAPRARWPTMYDLPSEEPEELGLPDEFHIFQPQLLREIFQPATYPPEQVFVGSDLNLYYSLHNTTWYKRSDWFAALGVSRLYEGHELRLSYVVWQEARPIWWWNCCHPARSRRTWGKRCARPGSRRPNGWSTNRF